MKEEKRIRKELKLFQKLIKEIPINQYKEVWCAMYGMMTILKWVLSNKKDI